MRAAICLLLLLSGCTAPALGAYAGVEIASIAVFHRALGDIVVSAVTGRDCSVVRLDRGQPYCRDDRPLPPEPFCTRTLGRVQCFEARAMAPGHPPGVADGRD